MFVLAPPPQYAPPASGASREVAVGRAFSRQCRERSEESRRLLRSAIGALVARDLADDLTPEASVIVFKRAVYLFAGLRALPGLALDHHSDGDECAVAYEEAFTMFVEALFGAPRALVVAD